MREGLFDNCWDCPFNMATFVFYLNKPPHTHFPHPNFSSTSFLSWGQKVPNWFSIWWCGGSTQGTTFTTQAQRSFKNYRYFYVAYFYVSFSKQGLRLIFFLYYYNPNAFFYIFRLKYVLVNPRKTSQICLFTYVHISNRLFAELRIHGSLFGSYGLFWWSHRN